MTTFVFYVFLRAGRFRVFCENGQAVKRSGAERESRRTAEESGMWRAYLRRERVTLERYGEGGCRMRGPFTSKIEK